MSNSLYDRLGGRAGVSDLVDIFYAKMQDDYRLNRFFNSTDQTEQADTLKALVAVFLDDSRHSDEEITSLLDKFFMAAFARNKRKSFVGGSDFGFLGIIIEQDHPSTKYLCDSHSHLLKFMPESFHYDAVMENLAASLEQLNHSSSLIREVLELAEQGRNPLLGK
jgi:truncated hemoglobin YjbI